MALDLCRATGVNPIDLNSACSSAGLGWAYSTNSNPSVPIGFVASTFGGGASCGNGPICLLLLSAPILRICDAMSGQNDRRAAPRAHDISPFDACGARIGYSTPRSRFEPAQVRCSAPIAALDVRRLTVTPSKLGRQRANHRVHHFLGSGCSTQVARTGTLLQRCLDGALNILRDFRAKSIAAPFAEPVQHHGGREDHRRWICDTLSRDVGSTAMR